MKISIVIPAYEYYVGGVGFLNTCLDSIYMQSFDDYEVIVSDHSVTDDIEVFCRDYDKIQVVYTRNHSDRGNSSANLNNAIKLSTGDIIKPMFQDDFMYGDNCLEIIHNYISGGEKWVVVGNNSYIDDGVFTNDFIPTWNDDIIFGINTLSSPSCMAYLNNGMLWDERLVWLMDCEFYNRLYIRYGEPCIEEKILVTNRIHPLQYTHTMSEERKSSEVDLMVKEHGNKNKNNNK